MGNSDDYGKSIPIHCIVEQCQPRKKHSGGVVMGGMVSSASATILPDIVVKLDAYAILPGNLPFSGIVRHALVKIGYSDSEAVSAKGFIHIRNWRMLTFDTVTENADATVEDILGELSSVVTLRIRLSSQPKPTSVEDVKDKLLHYLHHYAQASLVNNGCPIDRHVTSQICQGEIPTSLPDETKEAFNEWFKDYLKAVKKANNNNNIVVKTSPELSRVMPAAWMNNNNNSKNTNNNGHASNDFKLESRLPARQPSRIRSSAYSKIRFKVSFDTETEIPQLQKWFHQNQHPSREQMLQYVRELNGTEARKQRKPLDLTNVVYWFKNARAIQRRAVKGALSTSLPVSVASASDPSPTFSTAIGEEGKLEYSTENMEAEESALAPEGSTRLSPPYSVEQAPVLPRRDAVYIVQPQHRDIVDEEGKMEANVDLVRNVKREMDPSAKRTTLQSIPEISDEPQDLSAQGTAASSNSEIDAHSRFISASPAEDLMRYSAQRMLKNGSNGGVRLGPHIEKLELRQRHYSDDSSMGSDEESMSNSVPEELAPSSDHSLANGYSSTTRNLESYYRGEVGNYLDRDNSSPHLRSHSNSPSLSSNPERAITSTPSSGMQQHLTQHHIHQQLQQQRALQLAAMSYSLNMHHYMHPAAASAANALAMYPSPVAGPASGGRMGSRSPYRDHHQLPPINGGSGSQTSINGGSGSDNSERKKRSRVFIDPLTEIPRLERWFLEDTHPSSYMIEKYTDELNSSPYRLRFPKLEAKNIQLWFKNHRAKVKRHRFELSIQ